jgi:mono/diheme cytochrome c family protein
MNAGRFCNSQYPKKDEKAVNTPEIRHFGVILLTTCDALVRFWPAKYTSATLTDDHGGFSMSLRKGLLAGLFIAGVTASGIVLAQGATTPRAPNPTAEKMKNPIAADAASLERGKKVYDAKCANCHKPDGSGAEGGPGESGPPPSNLLNAKLEHGQSDGEIFVITKGGILPDLYMPMFEGVIKDEAIWDVVNYVQSLRKKK